MKLYLIRGLSGSGKTTHAKEVLGLLSLAADDYFYDEDNVYNFDPTQLATAHQECQRYTGSLLSEGTPRVAVANTFSCRWELEPYLQLAEKYEYEVQVIDLFDGGLTDEELHERNVHGVPLTTIRAMRERWEHDWESGNPTPPWKR